MRRGKAYIFNHEQFDNSQRIEKLRRRYGTANDRDRLDKILTDLLFEVKLFDDLTANRVKEELCRCNFLSFFVSSIILETNYSVSGWRGSQWMWLCPGCRSVTRQLRQNWSLWQTLWNGGIVEEFHCKHLPITRWKAETIFRSGFLTFCFWGNTWNSNKTYFAGLSWWWKRYRKESVLCCCWRTEFAFSPVTYEFCFL